MTQWTRDQIVDLLKTRNDAVEKGIVRIYQLQTADEQSAETTKHRNNVGFNGTDAKYGSYLARWVLSGRHLSGRHLERARRMCIRYSRQLMELANGKLAA